MYVYISVCVSVNACRLYVCFIIHRVCKSISWRSVSHLSFEYELRVKRPGFGFGLGHPQKECVCLVVQSCPTLCDPIDSSPPGSSVLGNSPGKNTRECPPPGDIPNPGIEPRSPTLQADSLLSEPPGDVSKSSSHLKESAAGHRSLRVRVGWCLLQGHTTLKGVCAITTVNR